LVARIGDERHARRAVRQMRRAAWGGSVEGMRVVLRLFPLLLLFAGFAAPASAAAPALETESFLYDIQISGSHTVDWAYASALDRPNCSSWSVGKGRFTATFKTDKPTRYEMRDIRRDGKLVQRQWGVTRERSPTFTIDQTGTWQSNNAFKMACTPCGPLSEYGPCKPDPPVPPKPSCPERTAKGLFDTRVYRRGDDVPKAIDDLGHLRRDKGPMMVVESRYSEDPKHASRCYPLAGGEILPLAQPAAIAVPLGRLMVLDPGKRGEYKGDRPEWVRAGKLQDQGQCGAIDGVLKMNACSLTKVKLQVRRVR
jgi:hypothetical protein